MCLAIAFIIIVLLYAWAWFLCRGRAWADLEAVRQAAELARDAIRGQEAPECGQVGETCVTNAHDVPVVYVEDNNGEAVEWWEPTHSYAQYVRRNAPEWEDE